ncbi:MAG: hypothetical protein HXY40_08455 [Chloroflexi bacterium]|nr:hypothetical protein [Chloroflexota bacterium]
MWAQLWGMIRYEIAMHWRRRGLLTMLAATVSGSLGIVLLLSSDASRRLGADVNVLLLVNIAGNLLAAGFPFITTEGIPLDRVYHMEDIVRSVPLPRAVYLLGKVFSVSIFVLAGMIVSALLLALAAYWAYGAFDVTIYARMWLYGLLPIGLLSAALGALSGAACATRRAALLAGVVVMAYVLLLYQITYVVPAVGQQPITTLQASAAHLLVGLALAWGWLQWREARV